MNSDRTAKECVETLTHAIQKWVDRGLCQNCAITAAATTHDIDRNTTEKVWIDHQVTLLDDETALD